jgi:hypothetical protein
MTKKAEQNLPIEAATAPSGESTPSQLFRVEPVRTAGGASRQGGLESHVEGMTQIDPSGDNCGQMM